MSGIEDIDSFGDDEGSCEYVSYVVVNAQLLAPELSRSKGILLCLLFPCNLRNQSKSYQQQLEPE
jgi:hypothetical protein